MLTVPPRGGTESKLVLAEGEEGGAQTLLNVLPLAEGIPAGGRLQREIVLAYITNEERHCEEYGFSYGLRKLIDESISEW
ncbi:MAG: hypothetical protein JJ971_09970 [Balneolaceae bacterium]|nr:hypothetical protein [Balneolaceae bacterium]MBO6546427.1 hypothetical protein [Balneolaceae bacterium]MBO6648786.1 hypothetical protein [Balneolaceae bacterium]